MGWFVSCVESVLSDTCYRWQGKSFAFRWGSHRLTCIIARTLSCDFASVGWAFCLAEARVADILLHPPSHSIDAKSWVVLLRAFHLTSSPSVAELDGLRQRNVQVAALHSQISHIEQGQVLLFLSIRVLYVLMNKFEIKKQLQDYDTGIKLLYGVVRFHRLKAFGTEYFIP